MSINFIYLNIQKINMKKLTSILVLAGAVFLFSSIEGFSQDNPLTTHPANYKAHPAAKRVAPKANAKGVLIESNEAVNYKRPSEKTKTKRASFKTSTDPKRNYKMPRTDA